MLGIQRNEASVNELDDELQNYFSSSRRYRSSRRSGAVVVVDASSKVYDFLRFLADNCKLDMSIVHVERVGNARKVIEDMGANAVKVVVVDASVLQDDANGTGPLPCWIDRNHPDIPVWVSNCEPSSEKVIRQDSRRVGVMKADRPLAAYIDALGFPAEAVAMASEYPVSV